ncbi:hypothetical protein [Streptomyces goshikiensis]|uniref:hypothetical protein n=1 Tax=Streptomyces goshikiensis TaxID=1942 RepID=UPI00367A227C
MSARTAITATAVVAAVAGTVLMPLSAYAAPATGGAPALRIELGAPVPSGPLTRGGATESFDLTVTNPSDKAAPFHPWLLGNLGSPIALKKTDVVFKVDEINAPDTASYIGQQDHGWQGVFYPAGKNLSAGFEVPAGGKLKWKVTVGLGKGYPVNSNAFELRASTTSHELAPDGQASLTLKAAPATGPAAKLSTHFENNGSCDGANDDETRCKQLMLWYRHEGVAFSSDLVTRLTVKFPGDVKNPDTQVRVMVDGKWTDVHPDRNGDFMLPKMPKDFAGVSADTFALQVKLGPKTQITRPTLVTLQAGVALDEKKVEYISTTATDFKLAPAKQAGTKPDQPKAEQSKPAKPAGSTTTQVSQTASSSAVTPVTAPAGGTPQASGSLAHTGSDSDTGLYAGLAAVLVALGGAAAWLGARRRGGATRA